MELQEKPSTWFSTLGLQIYGFPLPHAGPLPVSSTKPTKAANPLPTRKMELNLPFNTEAELLRLLFLRTSCLLPEWLSKMCSLEKQPHYQEPLLLQPNSTVFWAWLSRKSRWTEWDRFFTTWLTKGWWLTHPFPFCSAKLLANKVLSWSWEEWTQTMRLKISNITL